MRAECSVARGCRRSVTGSYVVAVFERVGTKCGPRPQSVSSNCRSSWMVKSWKLDTAGIDSVAGRSDSSIKN